MASLPTGTVTLFFTDVEGSTRLLEQLGDRYAIVLADHHRLLRTVFHKFGGHEVDTQGDALFVTFVRARDAIAASVEAQQMLAKHSWPEGATVRVRMGLHTGEPLSAETGYIGMDVHRAARISQAGHGGQILLSDATRALVEEDLPANVTLKDLGNHRLKDLSQPLHIFQAVGPDLPDDFPPLRSLSILPNNLPVQLTSFVGRGGEMTEVKRLLSGTRLLTLTGAGGSGKTRLALQVAADLLDVFPDGVWLVELAALTDPSLVTKAVAYALNVSEQPRRLLTETLTDALRLKSLLVILDNCEHLVTACAHLATTVLRACPNLRVLATSREALGVAGETTWPVPSLSVPDPQRLPTLERFTDYEAVQLFIERAMANAPQFTVTNSNAPAVAQVCHRLDGIPLAIELAAARVKVLAVEQIASRLDDRFRLLTGGSRTALPRQQTLRSAIDWSYDLLSQKERTVLRRLSIFAGGWTLEAAEAVCAGMRIKTHEVLLLLAQLVDKSLVNTETLGGGVRYRMLDTIRHYAQDRLVASGGAAALRTAHRTWYLDLAERAETKIRGPEETRWLDRLELEHDNLRAALEWSNTQEEDAEIRLRLVAALFRFWDAHTHWGEGLKWFETVLAGSRDIKSTARVRALYRGGLLVWRQGDYGRAMALMDESLTLAREIGDQSGIAMGLFGRGLVLMRQGGFNAATALFEESHELFRKLEDKWFMALVLLDMGEVARRGGDYAKAVAWSEESLAMFRTLGGKRWIANALHYTGHAVRLFGDLERAAGLFSESLALFGEVGDKWAATECIEGRAFIASMQRNDERAARLLGAADAARETFGITVQREESGDQERKATRERLGETAFMAAWAEGRAMTLEQAVGYALQSDG